MTTNLDMAVLAFTSPSLAGLWAAVSAGLGITVRTPEGLPAKLGVLREEAGLPPLTRVGLALYDKGADTPAAAVRLSHVLLETLETTLGAAI